MAEGTYSRISVRPWRPEEKALHVACKHAGLTIGVNESKSEFAYRIAVRLIGNPEPGDLPLIGDMEADRQTNLAKRYGG